MDSTDTMQESETAPQTLENAIAPLTLEEALEQIIKLETMLEVLCGEAAIKDRKLMASQELFVNLVHRNEKLSWKVGCQRNQLRALHNKWTVAKHYGEAMFFEGAVTGDGTVQEN